MKEPRFHIGILLRLCRQGTNDVHHVVALENGRVRVEPYEGDETTINSHRSKIGLPLLPEVTVRAMRGEE